ncbi:MAG: PadR family transcriptional regulator [Candidatus Lokiarchaeota archaeon]|nr:PadR family transcriptional regulator [Candidatus Lokiarchaeota archaeon]
MMKSNYRLSHVAFAVLGLVAERESHAKNINERIKERGMKNWTEIGKSSVYGVLKKLRKDELVNMRIEEQKEEGKAYTVKIYTITKYGLKVLKAKVYDTLRSFKGRRESDYDLALSMLPILSKEEQIEVFTNSLEIIKRGITMLKETEKVSIKKSMEQWNYYPLTIKALFYRPIIIMKSHMEFIKWILEQIEVEKEWRKY